MNGIDKITARIEAEAVADAAVLVKQTEERCAQRRSDAEKLAQEHYWTCARNGVKEVEERVQRYAKAADMEARKSVLVFKQETVESVFAAAREKLLQLPEEEYVLFLAKKAVQAAETGSGELILNAADREAVGEKVLAEANRQLAGAGKPAGLSLAPDCGDFSGGLMLRNGNIYVNCTIDALIDQARSDLAAEVAVALFS